jgi:hypothetical protein
LSNNLLKQQWYELLEAEKQLKFRWNELSREVNLRFRRLVPEREREDLSSEFQKRRGDFLKQVRELRPQADGIRLRYSELSKDAAVKVAIGKLKSQTKTALELGPSREFKKTSAWLTSAERATAPENFAGKGARKNARGRRTSKEVPRAKAKAAATSGTPESRPK